MAGAEVPELALIVPPGVPSKRANDFPILFARESRCVAAPEGERRLLKCATTIDVIRGSTLRNDL